jgi:hypothetical protein
MSTLPPARRRDEWDRHGPSHAGGVAGTDREDHSRFEGFRAFALNEHIEDPAVDAIIGVVQLDRGFAGRARHYALGRPRPVNWASWLGVGPRREGTPLGGEAERKAR